MAEAIVLTEHERMIAHAWEGLLARAPYVEAQATFAENQARMLGNEYLLAQSWLILGVLALDALRPGHALQHLMNAVVRFRWLNRPEQEWYALAAIARAWYQMGEYGQMDATMVSANSIAVLDAQTKFRWLNRIGMLNSTL